MHPGLASEAPSDDDFHSLSAASEIKALTQQENE